MSQSPRQSRRPRTPSLLSRRDVLVIVLREAEQHPWTVDYLADVLIAQLAIPRRQAGIIGPCVYCGTWLAATVDHVIPWSQGGTDDADNVVSACHRCNSSKGGRTPKQWRAAQARHEAERDSIERRRALLTARIEDGHTPASTSDIIGLPATFILDVALGGSVPFRVVDDTIALDPGDVESWLELEVDRQHQLGPIHP